MVVYRLEGPKLRNVTKEWEQGKALELPGGLSPEVIAGDPAFASQFGSGWFQIEDGKRWMGAIGRLRLGGPFGAEAKLWMRAFAPAELGKAQLRVRINGKELGLVEIESGPVNVEFPVPREILGGNAIEVEFQVSRTIRTMQDGRDLSLVFGQIGIR